jgi:hypothetical protein
VGMRGLMRGSWRVMSEFLFLLFSSSFVWQVLTPVLFASY